jgi:hypothetical protein
MEIGDFNCIFQCQSRNNNKMRKNMANKFYLSAQEESGGKRVEIGGKRAKGRR